VRKLAFDSVSADRGAVIQVDMHDRLATQLQDDLMVVGMQTSVAIILVELRLTLSGVRAALNVERGMALLTGTAPF
jgi:hypothetical protein